MPSSTSSFSEYVRRRIFIFYAVFLLLVAGWTGIRSFQSIHIKPCAHDEAYTQLWVTGHSRQDIELALDQTGTTSASNLKRLLEQDPARPLKFKMRLTEDLFNPPLYYILLGTLEHLFRGDLYFARSVSAAIRIINPLLGAWLSLEVFASPMAAIFTAILMYVSPVQMQFGITARAYPFLVGLALVATSLLLVWQRTHQRKILFGYLLVLIVSCCLSFHSSLLAIGHVTYFLFLKRKNQIQKRELQELLKGIGAVFILFLLWLVPSVIKWGTEESFLPKEYKSISYQALSLGKNVIQTFFDLNEVDLFFHMVPLLVISCLFFLLSLAFWNCLNDVNIKTKLFLFIAGANLIPYVVLDLIHSSTYFATDRHLVLALTMLILVVARLLESWVKSHKMTFRIAAWTAFGSLVAIGLYSCEIITRSHFWPQKSISYFNRLVIDTLNNERSPGLISNLGGADVGNILAMSNELRPSTKIRLIDSYRASSLSVVSNLRNSFVMNPTAKLRQHLLAQKYDLIDINHSHFLFRVQHRSNP